MTTQIRQDLVSIRNEVQTTLQQVAGPALTLRASASRIDRAASYLEDLTTDRLVRAGWLLAMAAAVPGLLSLLAVLWLSYRVGAL